MATSDSKGGGENEDLAKRDKIARLDLRLEFTQLLSELVGSSVWAEIGLWKVEKSSLGREASCWTVGRTGFRLNGEEVSADGCESQFREPGKLQVGLKGICRPCARPNSNATLQILR